LEENWFSLLLSVLKTKTKNTGDKQTDGGALLPGAPPPRQKRRGGAAGRRRHAPRQPRPRPPGRLGPRTPDTRHQAPDTETLPGRQTHTATRMPHRPHAGIHIYTCVLITLLHYTLTSERLSGTCLLQTASGLSGTERFSFLNECDHLNGVAQHQHASASFRAAAPR
jgi:hypothetical protein